MAKKEFKFSKDSVNIVIGINISLLAILIVVSNWVNWLSFLAKGITFVIGFVGFWVLVPYLFLLGLFISLRKTLVKFKLGPTLIGLFLIIAAIGLLTSHFATKPLYITKLVEEEGVLNTYIVKNANENLIWNRSISTFQAIFAKAFHTKDAANYKIPDALIDGGVSCSALGGGFFSFIFLGLFNQIAGGKAALTIVISVLLIVVGVVLILLNVLAKLIRNSKARKNMQRNAYYDTEVHDIYEEKREEPAQISHEPTPSLEYKKYEIHDEEVSPNNEHSSLTSDEILERTVESYNNQHTMQKAIFDFDNDEQIENNHIYQEQEDDYGFNRPNPVQAEVVREEPVPQVSTPYFNFENESEFTNEVPQPEPVREEPVNSQTYTDNSLNDIFNPDGNKEEDEFEQPAPVQAPAYVQPAPQVQSAPVQPQAPLEPEQPKKRVLHWDDDDDVVVDIPKAYVRPPYKFPPLSLLDRHENPDDKFANDKSVQDQRILLEGIFAELKIGAQIVGYTIGPSITQFDVKLNEGVSVKVFDKSLADISIRLNGVPIIFKQLVIGKPTSGLQVPNAKRTSVGLFEALSTYPTPSEEACDTLVPFGKDINGNVVSLKIADCPHMLVAGTTGSGKSVFVHNIILTLIMRNRPEDLKILLVDPKGVEMTFYKKIPHLICPMITEASKANVAFGKLIDEMDRRNKIFNSVGVRELKEYNKIAPQLGYAKLPTIVAFIDEYADLSEQCKDIEGKIQRIAQKARTAGIHVIIATQRPSVNIIGGVIKGNIPTRVALSVNSQEDSRVIIGESGAEKLLGNGDMLIDSAKLSRSEKVRVQSAFADTTEINKVANFLRQNYEPMYWEEFHDLEDHTNDISTPDAMLTPTQVEKNATDSQLYSTIKADVMQRQYCSISFIQRSYSVGFPKAGKIFAKLQEEGIVDRIPESAAKGCKVLVHTIDNEQGLGSIEQSELVREFDPYKDN